MFKRGSVRCRAGIALVSSVLLLPALWQGSAQADVTAVKGSAYGESCVVSVFGGPPSCSPAGPTPAVTLATNASNSPQSASTGAGSATAGPATIFSWSSMNVSTQGSLGPGGAVTSSATVQGVNSSGNEPFSATTLAGSCSAAESGASGATTITGGTLQTDNGDSDPANSIPDHAAVTVTLPASPAPNTTYDGHVHIGNTTDTFTYGFNEQTVNPDGSVTLNAAHQHLLGPTAFGNLIVGQSVCGVTGAPDTVPPDTSIASGPSGTIASRSASFAFSSSEAGSSFACKLDGPGATVGSYSACVSPKTYVDLANGSYTFSVRAKDGSGNTDPVPATRTFTVSVSETPSPTSPTPSLDTTPPTALLSGSRSQRLGRSVLVRVSCPDEACTATAGGSVRVPKPAAKLFKLKTVKAAISKGGRASLRPKLSAAARRAIRSALRRGRRVIVKLHITVTDAAGNKRTLTRRIRLKL